MNRLDREPKAGRITDFPHSIQQTFESFRNKDLAERNQMRTSGFNDSSSRHVYDFIDPEDHSWDGYGVTVTSSDPTLPVPTYKNWRRIVFEGRRGGLVEARIQRIAKMTTERDPIEEIPGVEIEEPSPRVVVLEDIKLGVMRGRVSIGERIKGLRSLRNIY